MFVSHAAAAVNVFGIFLILLHTQTARTEKYSFHCRDLGGLASSPGSTKHRRVIVSSFRLLCSASLRLMHRATKCELRILFYWQQISRRILPRMCARVCVAYKTGRVLRAGFVWHLILLDCVPSESHPQEEKCVCTKLRARLSHTTTQFI